jgi:carbamoyl-phosphate synthase large subunit
LPLRNASPQFLTSKRLLFAIHQGLLPVKEGLNILVLGVGGNVSQAILKALRLASIPCRVIGGCVSPLSMGLYTVDHGYVSPAANDPAFLDWLVRTCKVEHVDAVLSGVEPVLEVLATHAEELRALTGAVALVSRPEVLAIGADKITTCQWLRDQGRNYPNFADASDRAAVEALASNCGYPLVAKPRRGKGSYGVVLLQNQRDLDCSIGRADYVIQEYLGDEASEFTVGCFSGRDGQVRGTIAMSRELLHGTTYRAEVGEFPEQREEAIRIVEALKPLGPSNVQMRVHKGRPICFEINVRFSGTAALRARFGFNDVEATLRHYVMGEESTELPVITAGIAVRYWNELYIDPAAKSALEKCRVLHNPHNYHSYVEDYGVN